MMATDTDPRGQVTRHFYFDVPMWRSKVYDGNNLVAMHFVLDWDEAMDLANCGVRRIRSRDASQIEMPALTFHNEPHPTLPGVVVPVLDNPGAPDVWVGPRPDDEDEAVW